MAERTATDVLIVGGGPAGSSLAIRLARIGLSVFLADRAHFPRSKPCAEYLSPAGVDQIADLGLLPPVESGGVPLEGTTVVADRGSQLTGLFSRTRTPPARTSGLAVTRYLLDATLWQAAAAAGATVRSGWALQSVLQEGKRIEGGVFRHGDRTLEVRARVTVGADGLNSRVRRSMGGWFREPLDRMAIVARVTGVRSLETRAELRVTRSGYLGINPLPAGVTNLAMVLPRADLTGARGDLKRYLVDRLRRWPGLDGRIEHLTFVDRPVVVGPFARRARNVVTDGALLVGDAADFFDPFTGEGINSALVGGRLAASAIAGALDGGEASADRLAGYRRARRRQFTGKWAVERLIGYGMVFPRLFDRAVDKIGSKGDMAHTMIGVTGDYLPAGAVLNPAFLLRMVL